MATDRLGDMRLFACAAELGGLSAAGRKLGLSPAAASARIQKLEQALQARLFERTTRRLRLTDEGRLYLEHCRVALQAVDDAEAALQARRDTARGKIRIAATSDFGRHTLCRWLDDFARQHPEVSFGLTLSDAYSDFLHDEIDLAIRFGRPRDSSLHARRLAPNRRVLCAAPAYFDGIARPAVPADLAAHRFVTLQGAPGMAEEIALQRDGVRTAFRLPAQQAWESNDGAVVRAWLLEGKGIGYKSQWDVADDVAAGRLEVLLPEWETPAAHVHALFHRRLMPMRVRLLLDYLAGRFAQRLGQAG